MNCWNFTGNLGRDCETRFTAGGEAVVSFSVAVKAGFGDKATTTWVNCTMWGKRGQAVAEYLNKGALVGVSGEACLRPWKDKEGQDKQSLDVRVDYLTLLGSRTAGERPAEPAQRREQAPAQKPASSFEDFESDLPY
jgi:single-strand DNA-binding protein